MSLKLRIERAYDRMMVEEIKFSRIGLTKQQFVDICAAIRAVGLRNIKANYKSAFELDDFDFEVLGDIAAVKNGREMFMAIGKHQSYKDNVARIVDNLN